MRRFVLAQGGGDDEPRVEDVERGAPSVEVAPRPSPLAQRPGPGAHHGVSVPQRSDSEVFGREVGPPFIQVVGAANGPPLVHAYTVTYAPAKVVAEVAAPRRTAPRATQTPLSGGESGVEGARRWVEKFRGGGGRKPRFADTA